MEREAKFIPEEICSHLFQVGVDKSVLGVTDITSLALTCKKFEQLCKDDKIWSSLVALDFPTDHRIEALWEKPPFFKKNLYKFSLKRRLRRELASIYARVAADKKSLRLCGRQVEAARCEIDEETAPQDEVTLRLLQEACRFIDWVFVCSDARFKDCCARRDWMVAMNRQLKKLSHRLLHMIQPTGAENAGLTSRTPVAPAAPSDSLSASSSTAPTSCFLGHVLTTLKVTTEKQERILNSLCDEQGQIECLLRRLQDHEGHIVRITSQISSLTYPFEDSYEEDLDDIEDANHAEDLDDIEDDIHAEEVDTASDDSELSDLEEDIMTEEEMMDD